MKIIIWHKSYYVLWNSIVNVTGQFLYVVLTDDHIYQMLYLQMTTCTRWWMPFCYWSLPLIHWMCRSSTNSSTVPQWR